MEGKFLYKLIFQDEKVFKIFSNRFSNNYYLKYTFYFIIWFIWYEDRGSLQLIALKNSLSYSSPTAV